MIIQTNLRNKVNSGKVRDTYAIDDNTLLMVSTDRISAFDVVLLDGIPGKGQVLNGISKFWFDKTEHIIQNHLLYLADDEVVSTLYHKNELIKEMKPDIAAQSMIVKKANRIDVECVVRGYITGSAWNEYKREGTVSGQAMPNGLVEGQKFPEPIFTPTTKADEGHDENMTIKEVQDKVGKILAQQLEEISKAVYNFAHDYALGKNIILADTKIEFGFIDGQLTLIDELLTPDSSRFWNAFNYQPGQYLDNYDKQLVRNWLENSGWDKESTPPYLPVEIIKNTAKRYTEVFALLST
ncbi:MAG TPA: phosphoribosylaminoimidazolesuccinocarboxamide synthase [Dehalococcoidia bacterium]|jgi:phosphoribosylaminoimidazole-succinocarboxamide synthase|nr:phosphoribosylaminoimidazolesuccinocarboxamide synthase [Dehalococcoidia bacterium]